MRLFWHHALPYASSNNLNVCRCLGAVLSGKRFLASVWKHVAHQTIWVTASVVALLTGKEFFSSVRGLVILEMTSTIARIVALLTSEMPFSWTNGCALCILRFWGVVRVLLHCEQPKGCVNKRLLSWMGEQTFFEVISLCTWVAALCASIGFPSRVYEHVYLEAPSRCAGEVALFANNRLLSNVNWTALSPFSISCFRKSHSQAGLASVNQSMCLFSLEALVIE